MTVEVTTGAGGGAAVERVTRTMSLALGVGGATFTALSLRPFADQLPWVHPLWSFGVAAGVLLPPLAMAVLSPFAPVRVLRTLAGVCAASYLVGLLTLVPALPSGSMPWDIGAPWLFGVSVIPTAASAVAWRPAVAWPFVLLCNVVLGLDRTLAAPFPIPGLAFQDALHTFLFNAVFAALAFATYRAGRVLDATADVATSETRAVAAAEARTRERTRVEALLHDTVLVALLASARGQSRAGEQAASALAQLADVEQDARDDLPAVDWVWRLQALTTDLAPDARFSHETGADPAPVPAEVGQAVLEATAEALRNSVQHAGPAARAVHARVDGSQVAVTVLDDGAGFDPAAIRAGRLGVSVSILDRMRSLPGGRAVVVSRPGVGTRVSIGWSAG